MVRDWPTVGIRRGGSVHRGIVCQCQSTTVHLCQPNIALFGGTGDGSCRVASRGSVGRVLRACTPDDDAAPQSVPGQALAGFGAPGAGGRRHTLWSPVRCRNMRTGGSPPARAGSDMKVERKYLTTGEATAYLRLAPRALGAYRISGKGPTYHRFGRAVRYTRQDLDAWAATKHRRSAKRRKL